MTKCLTIPTRKSHPRLEADLFSPEPKCVLASRNVVGTTRSW